MNKRIVIMKIKNKDKIKEANNNNKIKIKIKIIINNKMIQLILQMHLWKIYNIIKNQKSNKLKVNRLKRQN